MFGFFKTKRQKLREERIFIYAQLAELFVQWGGLVPRSTDSYDFDKGIGVRYSVAFDQFGIGDDVIERIARHDELGEKISISASMCLDLDTPEGRVHNEKVLDLYRNQAYILCKHGYVGPLPFVWARYIVTRCRAYGYGDLPRLEILTNRNPRTKCSEEGNGDSKDA